MPRTKVEHIDENFLEDLANNSPNADQFKQHRRKIRKHKEKKPEIKRTKTGFMGLL